MRKAMTTTAVIAAIAFAIAYAVLNAVVLQAGVGRIEQELVRIEGMK